MGAASALSAARAAWTKPGLRFAATFGGLSAVLLAIYYFPHADRAAANIDGFLRVYARIAGAVLRLFEPGITVVGRTITGRYSLQIVKTCDAMDITILLGSAIAAWPAPWRRRVVAVLAACTLIFVTNVARICSLYFIGIRAPSSFDFIHLELWPAALLLMAVGFFWLYVGRPQPRPE
jgi:exosortase/archaeosortase family protein